MFELGLPWALLTLPAPLLLRWLWPAHREQVNAVRIPFFRETVEATGAKARGGAVVLRRTIIQMIVMGLVWTLLVIGLARPEWVGEPIVRTDSARDIMLAIDLSGSMDAVDFPDQSGQDVSRFEAVQRVVDQFVSDRQGDRIGLIVFGTRAYLQLPFTQDLETARSLVDLMAVAMAGQQTALGDAIGLAIRAFESSEVDQRLLILLTDGNDTSSKMTPINAAGIAASRGVTIYTIGVGDTDASGEELVDFEVLQAVAERAGGQFLAAEDEQGLAAVYRAIDELSPGEVRTESWRPRESLAHWPAAAALLLGLAAYLLMLLVSRRKETVA